MAVINPYLNFNGNTEEAFNFYRSVFGGEFVGIMRYKDSPEASQVPTEDQDKIMHMALPIGKNNILMATDVLTSMGRPVSNGNSFFISIGTESMEEAQKLFNGLSAGGQVQMPFDKVFWGGHFGMFTDRFGVQWMVSFDPEHLPS